MGGADAPPANTSQNTTTTSSPWNRAKPYLVDKAYKPNTQLFGDASQYYDKYSSLSNPQQSLNNSYFDTLTNRQAQVGQLQSTAQNMMNGGYDPTYGNTGTYQSDLAGSFGQFGAANPSQALQSALSGKIDNPYLQAMQQASIDTSMRGYNDALQQLQQQVLPQIGDQAFASGGYGGSRQAIAEGMALQQAERNARDLGIAGMDAGNQLYGSAYQNAQSMMGNTAQNLASLGAQNAQFNAGNAQNADQFNANLDLQQQSASAQNALQGLNAFQNGYGLADNTFNQQQAILSSPQIQQQNALNQYANIVYPGAGLGQQQTTSIPIYQNSMSQMLGGASSVAGLLSSLNSGK